ncbi:MAG: cytochrome c oxidase assembly protein [Actinomycetota bacterium]|nr:cytochrome c oxidase assembly protein [Actinomycetota bacterium]MDH5225277.1 cytochrome c oxidase assembly protein [Actinomycetota bacterium]MDH5314777.1 cytochrome c oxidase assembly protein [Actinomycetota bacterium]
MPLPPWHLHPDVWLLFSSIVAAYLLAARRHLAVTGEPTSRRAMTLFLAGMGVLWLGADWPVHDLAEGYLYLMHMTQHLLFTLIAAPLLIAGMPAWMLRALLSPAPVRRAFRVITRPLIALVFFNAVLLFTHWPAIVEASVGSEPIHLALHVLIVSSALVMWWPVMSPLPEMPSLSAPGQMIYLFLQSLAPTIPASFLTFGHTPLYPIYAGFPRIWGVSALTDQLIAGLIMKLAGGLLLWTVIAVIFFRWFEQEQRDGLDRSAYQNVHREIGAELGR